MFGDHFARMDNRAAKGAAASGSDEEDDVDDEEYEGGEDLLSMMDANLARGSKQAGAVKAAPAPATAADSDSEEEDGVDLLAMVAKLDGKGGKGGPAVGNSNTNRFWRTATGTVGGADSEYAVGAGATVADRSAGAGVGDMAEASQGAAASTDAASAVQQLSLASLMQGLAREGDGSVAEGGAQLKKQLSDLSAAGGPIAALAGSATQARAERKVAYGAASKDVSRWQAVVAANRAAPHVSFTHEARSALAGLTSKQTSSGLKDKFTPETDLEAEVSALLSAAGMDGEAALAASEANELTAADVTPAEAKKRTQQLAKLRALMFYDEQKKARANKIKSKAFRRVLKRKRLREAEAIANKLKEENPAQAALLEQESAMARAEARISQRHRARSKWVKKALALGGTGVAAAAYKAELNEHLQRAQELQAKINARPSTEPGSAANRVDTDSDDSDDSDDEEDAAADWELATEGEDANGRRDMQDLHRAREKLAAELAEVDAAEGAGESTKGAPPLKGLAGMKFMQTAASTSRAAAAEALAQVEAELAREERRVAKRAERRRRGGEASSDSSSDSEDDTGASSTPADPAAAGRRSFAGGARADDAASTAADSSAAKRSAKALRQGGAAGLQVPQVAGTATSRASASGAITVPGVAAAVGGDGSSGARGAKSARKAAGNYMESLAAANGDWLGKGANGDGKADGTGAESNPWMAAVGGAESGSDAEGGDLWGAGDALTATLADSRRLSKRAGMAAGKSKKSSAAATAAASSTGRAAVVDVHGALSSLETRKGRQQKRPRETDGDGPTQEDLVRRAFVTAATDDATAELEAEKAAAVEASLPKAVREERDEHAGWGSWTGMGAEASNAAEDAKRKRRRGRSGWLGGAAPGPVDVVSRKQLAMAEGMASRSDKGKKGVVLSQKRDRKLASHQAAVVPFPFTSAEQYARSIRAPLGKEWNTAAAVEDATRPEVALRAGMIVPAIASTKVEKSGDDKMIGKTTTSLSGRRGNALAPGAAKIGKRAVRTRDSSGKKRGRS